MLSCQDHYRGREGPRRRAQAYFRRHSGRGAGEPVQSLLQRQQARAEIARARCNHPGGAPGCSGRPRLPPASPGHSGARQLGDLRGRVPAGARHPRLGPDRLHQAVGERATPRRQPLHRGDLEAAEPGPGRR
jgi:hypothetical protein